MAGSGLMFAKFLDSALGSGVDAYRNERDHADKLKQEQRMQALLEQKQGVSVDPETGELIESPIAREKRLADLKTQGLKDQNIAAESDYLRARARAAGLLGGEAKKAAATEKHRVGVDNNVQKLSKRLDDAGLSELETIGKGILGKIDLDSNEDIPGFGMTGFLPSFAVSSEGKDARQAVKSLQNVILKARSGGSVSADEAKRMLDELGTGNTSSDAQLRTGLRSVMKQLNAKKQGLLAGFDDETKGEFGRRGGSAGLLDVEPKTKPTQDGGGWTPEKEDKLMKLRAKKAGKNAAK